MYVSSSFEPNLEAYTANRTDTGIVEHRYSEFLFVCFYNILYFHNFFNTIFFISVVYLEPAAQLAPQGLQIIHSDLRPPSLLTHLHPFLILLTPL